MNDRFLTNAINVPNLTHKGLDFGLCVNNNVSMNCISYNEV